MNTYLEQLNIDLKNQQSQKQMMVGKSYGHINHFGNSSHRFMDSNAKNEIIKKLYKLIDNVSAIKVFNYFLDNNLIKVFLDCYENLVEISSYHDITSQELINYVINYSKNTSDMLDYLKDELEDLLEIKVDKNDIKTLKDSTDDLELKSKLSRVERRIPTNIERIKNPEIVKELIYEVKELPLKNEDDDDIIRKAIDRYIKMDFPSNDDYDEDDDKVMPDIISYDDDDDEIEEVEPPPKEPPKVIDLIRYRRTKAQIEADKLEKERIEAVKKRFPELYGEETKTKKSGRPKGTKDIKPRKQRTPKNTPK